MSDSSRRGFLKVAGAGVATAGIAAAGVAGTQKGDSAAAAALPASAKREILVHVHDVDSGAISLMVQGHQVAINDPALAARIATALHQHPSHPAV